MAVVLYGDIGETQGSGVYLNVLRINSYKREAVFNGPDYLYTRHTLSVRATFNPGTQKDELVGKKNAWRDAPPHTLPAIPAARESLGPLLSHKIAPHAGNPDYTRPAVYTVEAVKHHLMQPRLQLQWAWDNVNVLLSPMPGMRTDETNGPTPISVDVVEFHSGKTMMVDWIVRTDVNECPAFTQKPWPVLSHQYGQREDLDSDFLRTTTTRGTVVFSASVLRTPNVAGAGTFDADDLRQDIFLPIPANMKREKITTSVSPDGLTVEYEVVDKELPLNWSRAGITRIEGIHTVENKLPSFEIPKSTPVFGGLGLVDMGLHAEAGITAAGRALGLPRNLIRSLRVLINPPNLANESGALFGACCLSTHHLKLRAYGYRGVARNALEDFIRDIIDVRVKVAINGGLPMVTLKSTITHSVEGNWCEAEEVYRGGPLGTFGQTLPNKAPNGSRVFGTDNTTGVYLTDNPVVRVQGPPSADGVRGTQTEALVSSALSRPCDPGANLPPAAPTQPGYQFLNTPEPPAWPRPVGG